MNDRSVILNRKRIKRGLISKDLGLIGKAKSNKNFKLKGID